MMTLSASSFTCSAIGFASVGYAMDQPVVSTVTVISYLTSVESFAAFTAVIFHFPVRSARWSGACSEGEAGADAPVIAAVRTGRGALSNASKHDSDARTQGLGLIESRWRPAKPKPCPPHDFGTAFPRPAAHHAGKLRVTGPFLERQPGSHRVPSAPTSVRHGGWPLRRLYQSLIFYASPDACAFGSIREADRVASHLIRGSLRIPSRCPSSGWISAGTTSAGRRT